MFKIATCILVAVCISFPEDVATASVPTSDSMLDLMNTVKGYFKDGVSDAIYKVENGVKYGENKIKNKVSEIEDIVKEQVNQVQDKISNKMSIVQEDINNMKEKIRDFKEKYNKEYVKEKVTESVYPYIQYFHEVLRRVGSGLSGIDEKFYTEFFNVVQKYGEERQKFLEKAEHTDIPCDKLKYKGQAFFAEIAYKSGTCVLDETQAAKDNIKEVVSTVQKLVEDFEKRLKNLSQYIKEKSFDDVFEEIQNVTKVIPMIEQVVRTGYQLSTMVESIKVCVARSVTNIVSENFVNFVQDGGSCLRDRIEYI